MTKYIGLIVVLLPLLVKFLEWREKRKKGETKPEKEPTLDRSRTLSGRVPNAQPRSYQWDNAPQDLWPKLDSRMAEQARQSDDEEGLPSDTEGGPAAVAPAAQTLSPLPSYAAVRVGQSAFRELQPMGTGVAEQPYDTQRAYERNLNRRHQPTAWRIGQSLSTAEGMAQAVVMAEVLQSRGGRRRAEWR